MLYDLTTKQCKRLENWIFKKLYTSICVEVRRLFGLGLNVASVVYCVIDGFDSETCIPSTSLRCCMFSAFVEQSWSEFEFQENTTDKAFWQTDSCGMLCGFERIHKQDSRSTAMCRKRVVDCLHYAKVIVIRLLLRLWIVSKFRHLQKYLCSCWDFSAQE